MKKAVITYNFGDYDRIEPVYWKTEGWDYLLFSDSDEGDIPKGWELKKLPESYFISDDPKRRANQIKYTPFGTCYTQTDCEYDMLVVIDANVSVNGDMNDFVDTYCMSSMDGVFLKHPSIDNAYEDIDLCAELKKDDHEALLKTSEHFKKSGLPEQLNYFQTGVSIRRNTSAWRIVEYWFPKEYQELTKRDQPVMNFVRWKYDVLDLNVIDVDHIHEYLKYENHYFEEA